MISNKLQESLLLMTIFLQIFAPTISNCSERYKPCFEATTSFENNRAVCQKLCGTEDPAVRCHSVTGFCECGTNQLYQTRIHSACDLADADTNCATACNIRALDGVLCQAKRPLSSFRDSNIFCLCAYKPIFPGREADFYI